MAIATVFDLLLAQLEVLGSVVDPPGDPVADVRALLAHTTDQSLRDPPRWSGVGDDCSPMEWSIAFRDGPPELRLVVEAQVDPASPASYWQASAGVQRFLVDRFGGSEARSDVVAPRCAPVGDHAFFVRWHAVEWRPGAPPRLKVYLNPSAGSAPPAEVVDGALRALGFDAAAETLAAGLPGSISHLALDLDDGPDARIKIYIRAWSEEEAVAWYGRAPGADPDDARHLISTVCGPGGLRRPAFVVLHHTDPAQAAPGRTVVNVPMVGHAADDAAAWASVTTALAHHGFDTAMVPGLAAAWSRVAPPGTPAQGAVNFVSFQRERGAPRVTVYLSMRAFAATYGWTAARDPASPWPSPYATS